LGLLEPFFYVYSYASGQLISKSLQELLKEDKTYINKIKMFLSAGESNSPENIFKGIGIDISSKDFWEKGIKKIQSDLDELKGLTN
jgi:oligoendopeptidase F